VRRPTAGALWKLLGLAGAAGVAATGVMVARQQRRRNAYTPDEVRARLQQRLAEAASTTTDTGA
jgi:glutamate dehydrogenase/leucine dehydrogenase